MFFAFVRRKRCGSCLTVRAGREAKHEGCAWERKVEGQYSGNVVTLEAFERPETLPPLPQGMHDAALHALFDDGFELVEYERKGNNPRPLGFIRIEGKITMTKASFSREHINKSHKGKADYDRAQVSADLRAMADANDASHITLVTRRISDPNVPSSKTPGKMSSLAFLEWEHN